MREWIYPFTGKTTRTRSSINVESIQERQGIAGTHQGMGGGEVKEQINPIMGQINLGPKCNPLDQYIDDYVTKQKQLRADWIEKFMAKDDVKLEPLTKKQCATCNYFYDPIAPLHPERRVQGRCRRNAPTHSGFPVVWDRDYCGEHEGE